MNQAILSNEPVGQTTAHWSQLPVNRFFATFNWDNRSPELQPDQLQDYQPAERSLDLRLTVSQFFGAINWSGAMSAFTSPVVVLEETSPSADRRESLTLSDFADLF